MVNEYPSEGKATHPDSVGERNMPSRKTMTHTAFNPSPSGGGGGGQVHYGQTGSGWDVDYGTNIGHALKARKLFQGAFGDTETKMTGERKE